MAFLDSYALNGSNPFGMLNLPPAQGFDPSQGDAQQQAAREAAAAAAYWRALAAATPQAPPAPAFGLSPDVPPPDPAPSAPQAGAASASDNDLPAFAAANAAVPSGIGTNGAAWPGSWPQPASADGQTQGPSFAQSLKSRLATIAGILSPEMRERQTQDLTAAALKSRGVAPEVADAAARNPELLRQVGAQTFSPKQYQHVAVRDAQGNWIPLTFDASSGQYRDARGNALPPGAFSPPAGVRAAPARPRHAPRPARPSER